MAYALGIYSLTLREIIRFYRQPSRIVGAVASPLVFWLLIGAGVGSSFGVGTASRPMNYLEYFYPGILLMILLFTSIFATISIIEDRREGFLQSVLVSAAPRSCFVLGKIFGGSILALFQAGLFLLLMPLAGIMPGPLQLVQLIAVLFLNAFALTALGFCLSWQFRSIQGFHAVMNLLLMPMWLLSGALFPPEGAPSWIQMIIKINPVAYGLSLIRNTLYGAESAAAVIAPASMSLGVIVGFGLVMCVIACVTAGRRSAKDLP